MSLERRTRHNFARCDSNRGLISTNSAITPGPFVTCAFFFSARTIGAKGERAGKRIPVMMITPSTAPRQAGAIIMLNALNAQTEYN